MGSSVLFLGTTVQITSILSDAPTGVNITIKDPSGIKKVTQVAMSASQATVFTYAYQSAAGDVEGTYTALLEATVGAYTVVEEVYFDMKRQTYWQQV